LTEKGFHFTLKSSEIELAKFFFGMKIILVLSCGLALSARAEDLWLYTQGPSALKEYLQLIEGAKESIELESFVFQPDRVGQLILASLEKKAQAGVKVRLILDAYGSRKYFSLRLLNALSTAGLEIGFYNSRCFHPLPIDHRKFLIVDGKEVFFGGRNISEENFAVNLQRHRLDYSLKVQGRVVNEVRASFEEYWRSPWVKKFSPSGNGYFKISSEALSLQNHLSGLPLHVAGEFHPPRAVFVSDEPSNRKRLFAEALATRLSRAQSEVIIETPFFAAGSLIKKTLRRLLADGKAIILLTAETHDHSATLTYSVLSFWSYYRLSALQRNGAQVFVKDSGPSPEAFPLWDEADLEKSWGSHCKVTLFDRQSVLFASFNYDLLSEEHNAEAGIYFLDSPELAAAVRKIEETRIYRRY
jgi:putative cardiolipin synthase